MAKQIPVFSNETAATLIEMVKWFRSMDLSKSQFKSRPNVPHRTAVPVTVENESGEEIPPYGCMKVTGATEVLAGEQQRFIITVTKPDGSGSTFLFNGARAIAAESGSKGQAQNGPVVKALVDSGSSDTPAVGESWGPASDWGVELGNTGLTAYGTIQDDADGKYIIGNSIVAESTTVKAKLSGVIDARDGDEPDSQLAEIVRYDSSSGTLYTTGEEITVYSWVTFDIGHASYGENIVEVTKHDDGLWWISGEDAHDDATSDTIVDLP